MRNTTPRHTISNVMKKYENMTDAEIIVERDSLRLLILHSHKGIHSIDHQVAKNAHRNIARLNTILNKRRGYK